MKYRDLRDFVHGLEGLGVLKRVVEPVSVRLEMTALADRVLRAGGPALLFERPEGYRTPVLANLLARRSVWRWAWARRTPASCARWGSCWLR